MLATQQNKDIGNLLCQISTKTVMLRRSMDSPHLTKNNKLQERQDLLGIQAVTEELTVTHCAFNYFTTKKHTQFL